MQQAQRQPEGTNHHEEPPVTTPLERVVEASQRVVVDRIDLLRLEALEAITRTLRGTAMLIVGGVLLGACWFGLETVVVILLSTTMPLAASLAIVTGVNGVGGAALLLFGIRQLRGENFATAPGEGGRRG